jgi:hypothetical protein
MRERIAIAGMVLVALEVIGFDCYYRLNAMEPPLFFFLFWPWLVFACCVGLAVAFWRSRVLRVAAPFLLLCSFIAGARVAGSIGTHKVQSFCDSLLVTPEKAGDQSGKFAAFASVPGARCKIIDIAFGGDWEIVVYAGEEPLAYFTVRSLDGRNFELSTVSVHRRGQ